MLHFFARSRDITKLKRTLRLKQYGHLANIVLKVLGRFFFTVRHPEQASKRYCFYQNKSWQIGWINVNLKQIQQRAGQIVTVP